MNPQQRTIEHQLRHSAELVNKDEMKEAREIVYKALINIDVYLDGKWAAFDVTHEK